MFLLSDDATVVPVRVSHKPAAWQKSPWRIAWQLSKPAWAANPSKNSSATRLSLSTAASARNSATRRQLIDRLFAYRFEEFDKKWDVKFRAFEDKLSAGFAGLESALESRLEAKLETALETKLEAKLETKLEAKLKPIRNDLRGVKNDLAVVKTTLKILVARLK